MERTDEKGKGRWLEQRLLGLSSSSIGLELASCMFADWCADRVNGCMLQWCT